MSEESLREIIGLVKKSKWNQVKKFIKFVIQKTLKKNAEYRVTALDVSINGKKQPKYNSIIKNREQIKSIAKISDFNHLSFYQSTRTSNNLIDISQNNGTIIVLAKYLGPSLNNHQIFDFSVHMDVLEEPFFTNGTGEKLSCSEFLETISYKKQPKIKPHKKKIKKEIKQLKEKKVSQDVEIFVFEKLTNKNAFWNKKETKAFKNWKARNVNNYRIETGKIAYYKKKPTNQFSLYLKSLLKNEIDKKKTKPIKQKSKKHISKKDDQEVSEAAIFEKLTGKNSVWNGKETKNFQKWKEKTAKRYSKESGKPAYYKGKPTNNFTQYLRNLPKAKADKKKILVKKKTSINKPKKEGKIISESFVFEALTGKNAVWNGNETKNFQKWKAKTAKRYRKKSGKPAYYGGNLTQNFKNYLKNLASEKSK